MLKKVIDGGIELRLIEEQYAEDLYQLVEKNRDHLGQWMPWVEETHSQEATMNFIKETKHQYATNGSFQTLIFVDDRLSGVIGCHSVDWEKKSVSLGYWVDSEMQGRGVITKSCQAYIDHIFSFWDLDAVEIFCAVSNKKSRAIPERLGFQLIEIQKERELLRGEYVDHARYRLENSR